MTGLPFLFLKRKGEEDKFQVVLNEVKTLFTSNPLSEIQNNILMYIGVYTAIALITVFFLNRKINKLKS